MEFCFQKDFRAGGDVNVYAEIVFTSKQSASALSIESGLVRFGTSAGPIDTTTTA
jgi:hypothetical protein